MSSSSGSSIATSGLIFYYDMNNTQKSWKGAPTTNLLINPTIFSGSNWDQNAGGVTATSGFIDPSYGSTAYLLMETATTDNHRRGQLISGSVGTTRRFSFYAKAAGRTLARGWSWGNGDAGEQTFDLAAGTCSGTLSPLIIALGNGWYYCSFGVPSANNSTVVIGPSNGVGGTATYLGDITKGIYVWRPQLEAGTFATPFVDTTRSTTQAIVDLTNNNTLTATSLTYNSDNTYSFDGSSNNIDVTGSGFTSGMGAYTFTHWSRRDVENRMPLCYRAGSVFYQYGDNSWYYTHGGVAGEYYYPHAVSIPVGTYGFYCIVYNGADVSIYRNGVFEGSQATTGTADWSNGLKIGMYTGHGYYYQGKIDSVSFYNRALSAGEVNQNFNAMRSRYGL